MPQNPDSHKTLGRQFRPSNQLSLPRQDDCKTRNGYYMRVMHFKPRTKHTVPINNGSNIKQCINNNRVTAKFPSTCISCCSNIHLIINSIISIQPMFCLIINPQLCNSNASFVGGPNLFSPWRNDLIVSYQYIHFLFQRSCHTGKNNSNLTVVVFGLPGGTASKVFCFFFILFY